MPQYKESKGFLEEGMPGRSFKSWCDLVTYIFLSSTIAWIGWSRFFDSSDKTNKWFVGYTSTVAVLFAIGLLYQSVQMFSELVGRTPRIENLALNRWSSILIFTIVFSLLAALYLFVIGLIVLARPK